MGYETHFRLKGELDDKFKSWMRESHDEDSQEYKDILIATCLKSYVKDNDYTNLVKARRAIRFAVRIYINYIGQRWKHGLEEELKNNNNETWFIGWRNAHNDATWTSEEDLENWFTSHLFMDSIRPFVGEPDERGEETRLQNIHDTVEDIDDCVRELWDYLFIERYRNSDDAWESDGYDRKYPEEIEKEKVEEEKVEEEKVEEDIEGEETIS